LKNFSEAEADVRHFLHSLDLFSPFFIKTKGASQNAGDGEYVE